MRCRIVDYVASSINSREFLFARLKVCLLNFKSETSDVAPKHTSTGRFTGARRIGPASLAHNAAPTIGVSENSPPALRRHVRVALTF